MQQIGEDINHHSSDVNSTNTRHLSEKFQSEKLLLTSILTMPPTRNVPRRDMMPGSSVARGTYPPLEISTLPFQPSRDMQRRDMGPGSSATCGSCPLLQRSISPSRLADEAATAPSSSTDSPPIDPTTISASRPPLLSKARRHAQSSGSPRPASIISKSAGSSLDSFINSVRKLAKHSVAARVGSKLRTHSLKGRTRSRSPPALQFFFMPNPTSSPVEPAQAAGPCNPLEPALLQAPPPPQPTRPLVLPNGDLRHLLRSNRAAAPPPHPAEPTAAPPSHLTEPPPPTDALPAEELNRSRKATTRSCDRRRRRALHAQHYPPQSAPAHIPSPPAPAPTQPLPNPAPHTPEPLSKGWAPESLEVNRWKRARKGPLRGWSPHLCRES